MTPPPPPARRHGRSSRTSGSPSATTTSGCRSSMGCRGMAAQCARALPRFSLPISVSQNHITISVQALPGYGAQIWLPSASSRRWMGLVPKSPADWHDPDKTHASFLGHVDPGRQRRLLIRISPRFFGAPAGCTYSGTDAPSLAATLRNFSSASSRLATISAATSSGGGRLSGSVALASLSQKMSRFSLSRLASSS